MSSETANPETAAPPGDTTLTDTPPDPGPAEPGAAEQDAGAGPPVTPSSAVLIGGRIHTLNRPNMVSVGTIVWLASELMFFAGLFGIYFTIRAQSTGEWPPQPTELDIVYAAVFTTILIASSFTCQLGVFAAEKGDVFALRRWYLITLAMGLIFVLGQANEYYTLVTEHETTISSSSFGTVFYLTTGFHGLHVIGGLIAFVLLIAKTKISKFTPAQATSAIVVSYYWHFVDVVWIGLFATIYIIR